MAWAGPMAVCPWNGKSYSASMTFAAPASAASGFPTTSGFGARRGRRAAHVLEQVFRCREGRCRRLLPVDLELSGRLDRLLFPLADNRDVVALAHHLDESGDASDGRLVDADQLGARHRRLHVARMNHAGKLDVHGPFQRAVHLGRNVIALQRLADDLEVLYRLHLCHTGGRIDVVARQRDIEPFSADQFSVGDFPGGIGFDGDHALADGELIDRHTKPCGCHLQQDSPGLGSDAPHGPAIDLDGIRTARSALIDGDVGAAHDEVVFVVCDVQFIGHHLPEGRSGALAAVRLADVEGRRAVLMNDDPRIELSESRGRDTDQQPGPAAAWALASALNGLASASPRR